MRVIGEAGRGCCHGVAVHDELLQFRRDHLQHLQVWCADHGCIVIEPQALRGVQVLAVEIEGKRSLHGGPVAQRTPAGQERCLAGQLGILLVERFHVGIVAHFHIRLKVVD